MNMNRVALAVCMAGSMMAGNAIADIVTLNPSAANAGAANGSVLSAANGAFDTAKATTNFGSLLTINSAPGAAGAVGSTESGFFMVEGFSPGPQGVRTNYNIYALFDISGTGSWSGTGAAIDPYKYTASPFGLTVSTTLYGSPGSSSLGATTPTSLNPYGITPDAQDFILGTTTLLVPDKATATLGLAGNASTEFGAILDFIAAVGTTGVGGFWQAPNPFLVDLSTSATGVPPIGGNGTTFAVVDGKTLITTNVDEFGVGSGSGNILFAQSVPEPGSVALVGLALLGLGLSRRRNSKSA